MARTWQSPHSEIERKHRLKEQKERRRPITQSIIASLSQLKREKRKNSSPQNCSPTAIKVWLFCFTKRSDRWIIQGELKLPFSLFTTIGRLSVDSRPTEFSGSSCSLFTLLIELVICLLVSECYLLGVRKSLNHAQISQPVSSRASHGRPSRQCPLLSPSYQ